jgi:hypothetical protein
MLMAAKSCPPSTLAGQRSCGVLAGNLQSNRAFIIKARSLDDGSAFQGVHLEAKSIILSYCGLKSLCRYIKKLDLKMHTQK